jgi:exonuclease SbcC
VQRKEKRDASFDELEELQAENVSVSSRLEKELPGLIGNLDSELKELLKVSEDSVNLLESKLENIEEQLQASKEVADLEEKVGVAGSEKSSALNTVAESKAILSELEERRLSQMAYEISQQMQDGEPCQVCGSKEHPKKPVKPANLLTPEQLEKAKETLLADEALLAKASKKHLELAAELKATKSVLKIPAEKLEAESENLKQAILRTSSQLERKLELTENLDGLKIEQVALRDRMQELTLAKNKVEEAVKQADVEISSLTAELSKTAVGFESINHKLSFLSELKDVLEKLNEQQIQMASRTSELKMAQEALKILGTSKHFGDIASAEDEVSRLEPELNGALELLTLVSSSVKKSEELLTNLQAALKTRASLLESSVTLLELDRVLFQGRNPAKQTIDTFVLQNMFSEVVHAANSHFSRLLEGRYEIRLRSDENTKGNAQTGLDLEILDLMTQKPRAPKSLSGGEVFCASLSLALGLSDVVLSANGGIRIETFFIDEGFGSLDGERLNQVMEMLNMIQNTGRTVGVISHVEDMKQAILDRIEVRPAGKAGASTLSVSWAN